MTRIWIVLSLFLTTTPALAYRGTIPPPTFVEGQQVYTVPDGWSPPGIGQSGIQQLNGELGRLHYPFKVVFVETLPDLNSIQHNDARSKGFSGDRDTLMIEYGTAALASDWAETQPDRWNASTDTVFVLSFNPRKFAWVPGGDRRARLGLEGKAALSPYEAYFIRAVQREPKDPVGGIAALARSFDEYIYQNTDPEVLAARAEAERADREARAEAERKEAEARRLRTARGALDGEIMRLSNLLDEKEYLPADVDAYRSSLEQGRALRLQAESDPPTMLAMATEMKPSTDVLDKYVSDAKHKAFMATAGLVFKWLLYLTLAGAILVWFLRRRSKLAELRQTTNELISEWEEKVSNAHQRWMDSYLNREQIIGLDGGTGKTKDLFDRVTALVDDILIRIQAMDGHVKACRALADKGGFFNFQPLLDAQEKLEAPFEFDTGVVNRSDLFGKETKTLMVEPEKFASTMKRDFKDTVEGWERLNKAAEMRLTPAAERIPHGNMDLLFERATKLGVPHHWFDEHPLYGDDASDETFYQKLDTLRMQDPLSYEDEVEQVLEQEEDFLRTLDELEECSTMVTKARVESLPALDTKVAPEDDPQRTLAAAWHAENEFRGLLASSRNQKTILVAAEKVVSYYDTARRQHAALVSAMKGAADKLKEAGRAHQKAMALVPEARKEVQAATGIYAKASRANDFIKDAERSLALGERAQGEAERALQNNEHLDARKDATLALTRYEEAEAAVGKARSFINQLVAEKAKFERAVKEAQGVLRDTVQQMGRYGQYRRNLNPLAVPTVQGAADYLYLLRQIEAQQEAWQAEVRTARTAYDAEQRRIREEEERQARIRREAEEAERRRRSSYSSSYSHSSSSSSFGGGGFGGSSGSCGGGGFGGSSGSW